MPAASRRRSAELDPEKVQRGPSPTRSAPASIALHRAPPAVRYSRPMHTPSRLVLAFVASLPAIAGCGGGGPAASATDGNVPTTSLGTTHDGSFNLGPVDWAETEWHNACAPYPASIQSIEGTLLAGVSNAVGTGDYCDACLSITTGTGRSLVARVVTYGDTNAPGDLDLSPEAYAMLDTGVYPRAMSWHLVSCPTTMPLYVQFQTGANEWWTSFWIRNPRVAIARVEVTSTNHPTPVTLTQGGDGTFTDGGGFGAGAFTLAVIGVDGSRFEQRFEGFQPGELITACGNM